MSTKVLSRLCNDPGVYHRVFVRRRMSDDPVISGLSITPSDIERLSRQGIPVSVPNAESFYHIDSGYDVPPELKVDADRNTLWEMSQKSRMRILKARKKEYDHLT